MTINPAECPPNLMYRGTVKGKDHILRRGAPEEVKPWAAMRSDFDYTVHADSEVSDLVEIGEWLGPVEPGVGTASPEEVEELLERGLTGPQRVVNDWITEQYSSPRSVHWADKDVLRHVAAIIDHGSFDNDSGTLGEQVAERLQAEGLLAERWTR